MSSPLQVYRELKDYFKTLDLRKKNKFSALVTAGPTREYIDPVRYLSNNSSGKQGYEIAKALKNFGIKTTLITGPTNIEYKKDLKIIKTISGRDMLSAVKKNMPVDIVICTAAVADFYPVTLLNSKIKKDNKNEFNFRLKKNPDILEFLGKSNKYRPKVIVGFSAETENIIKNSKEKLRKKRCDLIVANDVSRSDIGFNVDYNEVDLIFSSGEKEKIKKAKKNIVANLIVEKILNRFLINDGSLN